MPVKSKAVPALGKGEVDSSILSSSTIKNVMLQRLLPLALISPIRQQSAERRANTTARSVDYAWSLFAGRSVPSTPSPCSAAWRRH